MIRMGLGEKTASHFVLQATNAQGLGTRLDEITLRSELSTKVKVEKWRMRTGPGIISGGKLPVHLPHLAE